MCDKLDVTSFCHSHHQQILSLKYISLTCLFTKGVAQVVFGHHLGFPSFFQATLRTYGTCLRGGAQGGKEIDGPGMFIYL